MTVPTGKWRSTACLLCECNGGIEVRLGGGDGRRFAPGGTLHWESDLFA